jgi:hypothetical protein
MADPVLAEMVHEMGERGPHYAAVKPTIALTPSMGELRFATGRSSRSAHRSAILRQ